MCPVKMFDYKVNADLNKKVFNLDLKISKEGLSRITKTNYSLPRELHVEKSVLHKSSAELLDDMMQLTTYIIRS